MARIVVAPHMDDESLGCGGLLAKSPHDSVVITVTAGSDTRVAEHEQALRELGVTQSVNLGFEDGETTLRMTDLVRALDEQFSRWRPRAVYLPYPSLHQDHIAAYEAGMRACRISMNPDHWFVRSVAVYDIAVYDMNLYPSDLRFNVFEELSEEDVTRKERACRAYASENPGGAHPMNSARQMAAAVGHVRLAEYAEQFALVRWVR